MTNKLIDNKANRFKFTVHGFFFSSGINTAEPSTILPLIVSYFSSSNVLIGIFSAIFRGGNIVMQLFTAYHAQAYARVMKPLRILFMFRFLSWFGIGASIFIFGNSSNTLTLLLAGLFLFLFSFTAGLGTIYFHELLGKVFTPKYRGKTIAYRQFFMGVGGIVAGIFSGFLLKTLEAPKSYAYIFMNSAGFMAIGYAFLGTVKEFPKKNTNKKEERFSEFMKNSLSYIADDKKLNRLILSRLFSYAYLFVFPFIVVKSELDVSLAGLVIGSAIPFQIGTLAGNSFWGYLSYRGKDYNIISYSFLLTIIAIILAIFANKLLIFILIFLLIGCSSDGYKLAFRNIILTISPENKRPVYWAIYNNLTAVGLFFSIPGGLLLQFFRYQGILIFTSLLLLSGLFFWVKNKAHIKS